VLGAKKTSIMESGGIYKGLSRQGAIKGKGGGFVNEETAIGVVESSRRLDAEGKKKTSNAFSLQPRPK